MRSFAAILSLLAVTLTTTTARAADPLVESAVNALAQLTDPRRLETLPEETFRAQLGPALGWLNAARRRDVSPEAVIARALARNGLTGERARLTREALLRNLARADAWEMFTHADSARALADGKPAPIPAGIHRGHFASAMVILPEGLGPRDHREFACLVLRADDETPPRPPPGSRHRQSGDLMARNNRGSPPVARRPARRTAVTATAPLPPGAPDEDPLPVLYTAHGNNADGTVVVREEVAFGQEVSLGALGGPARKFVLRAADGGSVRFELADDTTAHTHTVPLAQEHPAGGRTRVWRIYDEPGALRITLYDAAPGADGGGRTVLFEFPPGHRSSGL